MGNSVATHLPRPLQTGAEEARLLTELERQGVAVLVLRRHRPLLSDFSDAQLRDVVHGLSQKGWLDRIEAGKYVVVPRAARRGWTEHPFVVAEGIAPADHYVSYWSALSHHDLTEQLPRVVYVAVRDAKKPGLVFKSWRYRFVTLAVRKFFGFREEDFPALNGAATVPVRIAEPEKSIVDSLDREDLAGGFEEVVKAIRRGLSRGSVSPEHLTDYAVRFGSNAVIARLGYILERVAPTADTAPLRRAVRRRGDPPFLSLLAPRAGATLDAEWHVRVNVPNDAFDEESPG